MKSVRAVLFDLDGVLVDSYEAWFRLVRDGTRKLGCPEATRQLFAATWGQGVEADIDTFFRGHTLAEVDAYYHAHFRDYLGDVQVAPDGAKVVASLQRRGIKTAIITNTPAEMARATLVHAGITPDALVGSDDVPHSKPAPDMVLKACELLAVGCDEAIVVGDSRFDRQAAAAAGVRFVGYRQEGDLRIDELEQVLEVVG